MKPTFEIFFPEPKDNAMALAMLWKVAAWPYWARWSVVFVQSAEGESSMRWCYQVNLEVR